MLEKDPAERITIPQLKKHPFFSGMSWDDIFNKLTPPIDIRGIGLLTRSFAPDELKLVQSNSSLIKNRKVAVESYS